MKFTIYLPRINWLVHSKWSYEGWTSRTGCRSESISSCRGEIGRSTWWRSRRWGNENIWANVRVIISEIDGCWCRWSSHTVCIYESPRGKHVWVTVGVDKHHLPILHWRFKQRSANGWFPVLLLMPRCWCSVTASSSGSDSAHRDSRSGVASPALSEESDSGSDRVGLIAFPLPL